MEPIPSNCYPSNYFDPFGDEPTHGECSNCMARREWSELHDGLCEDCESEFKSNCCRCGKLDWKEQMFKHQDLFLCENCEGDYND